MSRYRRVTERKLTKKHILIVCCGQTEKIYIDILKTKFPNVEIDVILSKYSEDDYVIKEAIKNKAKYVEIWAVFDKDNSKDFDRRIWYAKSNGIKCAYSNVCIEYWFYLHFIYQTKPMSYADLKSELTKKLSYVYDTDSRTIRNVSNDIESFTYEAIKRAKIGYEEHKAKYGENPSKMCSCTTVFELVERFRKWEKEM